jgi:hypothetical protein
MDKTEKCYFCDFKAEYNEVVKTDKSTYIIKGVCKVHLHMGLSV